MFLKSLATALSLLTFAAVAQASEQTECYEKIRQEMYHAFPKRGVEDLKVSFSADAGQNSNWSYSIHATFRNPHVIRSQQNGFYSAKYDSRCEMVTQESGRLSAPDARLYCDETLCYLE